MDADTSRKRLIHALLITVVVFVLPVLLCTPAGNAVFDRRSKAQKVIDDSRVKPFETWEWLSGVAADAEKDAKAGKMKREVYK